MKIQQIRNATLKIAYGGKTFLTDPWLQEKGALGTFADKPFRCLSPEKETVAMPMCGLPMPREEVLQGVDAYVVTHIHPDHIDMSPDCIGNTLDKNVPVFVQGADDAQVLMKNGFTDINVLYENSRFGEVQLVKTPGWHGTKIPMCPTCGVVFRAAGEKSLYVAGDTIWYDGVRDALLEYRPDIVVLNACAAEFTTYGRLIMNAEDVARVHECLPDATIIISHMDNVAHASITRADMRMLLKDLLGAKSALMPEDGETLEF